MIPCDPSSLPIPGIPRTGEAGKHPAATKVPHAADEMGDDLVTVVAINVGFWLDTVEGQFVGAETEKILAKLTTPRRPSDTPRAPQLSAALPGH